MAVHPNGTTVYLTSEQKRLLIAIDVETLAFSADGARAFVANTGEGSLSVLDLKSMKVLHTYPAGNGPDGITTIRHAPPSSDQ